MTSFFQHALAGYFINMRKIFAILGVISLFTLSIDSPSSAQVSSSSFIPSVVRIDIKDSNDKLLSFATGVVIDPDGRILTNERNIRKWKQNANAIASVCITKNDIDAPNCPFRARLIDSSESLDLSLLQVTQGNNKGDWMSIEEYVLRTRFAFSPIKTDWTVTSQEGVTSGDRLSVFNFLQSGDASITQTGTQVTGFARTSKNGKSAPALVRVEGASSVQSTGGIFIDTNGTLVGIATKTSTDNANTSSFTSLPLINQFLKKNVGTNYLAKKELFLLNGPLNGVFGGSVQTTSCPMYSTKTSGKTCSCNDGFFAVGNSCVLAQSYCPLVYGKDASYELGLKACLCPEKDGRRICTKNVLPPLMKPATTVVAPSPTKTFTCPTNASYNPSSWACECDKGYVRDTKLNACKKV